jgi:putative ABC transport system permease protein
VNFVSLAVKSTFRNRLRTVLTAVGVAVAVIAFLFLRTVVESFSRGVDNASQDRLVVRNKTSFTVPLPLAYFGKIKAVPGVGEVSWNNWFGGTFRDPRNFFPRFAVDPETYFKIYDEFQVTPDELGAFLADRKGCVIGPGIAEKYGFKVGDRIPIKGDIYPGDWDFTVRAIYRGREAGTEKNLMFLQWKLLDESVPEARKNQAGTFVLRVNRKDQSAQVAAAIDALFANSSDETRTESEKAFQLSFFSQISSVVLAIQVVSLVMLVILALILGNTMAMSTRERIGEYAVMRSLGFRPTHVVLLVLAEGFVVAVLGYAAGAGLAPALVRGFAEWGQKQFGNFLRGVNLTADAMAWAAAAALVGGVVATAIPALRAGRLNIVEALRKVE